MKVTHRWLAIATLLSCQRHTHSCIERRPLFQWQRVVLFCAAQTHSNSDLHNLSEMTNGDFTVFKFNPTTTREPGMNIASLSVRCECVCTLREISRENQHNSPKCPRDGALLFNFVLLSHAGPWKLDNLPRFVQLEFKYHNRFQEGPNGL